MKLCVRLTHKLRNKLCKLIQYRNMMNFKNKRLEHKNAYRRGTHENKILYN